MTLVSAVWPARRIGRTLAVIVFCLGLHAAAEDAASSYRVGEQVEVKPTSWQDVWEPGVVTAFSYDHSQLIIKSATADRAFVMGDVRHAVNHAGAPPIVTPSKAANSPANPPTTPAPAAAKPAAPQGGLMGQRVMAYVSGSPYPGTVVGVGEGTMQGYYLIHFDKASGPDSYAKASNVVPIGSAPAPGQTAAGSQKGNVNCVMGTIGGKPACLPTAKPH